MATIPVEKKSGAPWWLWLLGLLLLALLIWFFFLRGDDDDVVVTDPVEQAVPVATATALNLNDVWVTRVVGDKTFYVAPDSAGTDETLVYLEEEPTPGTATEGRYDVTPGQHISLVGTMMPVAGADFSQMEDVTAAEVPGTEYVRASALTVLNGMSDDSMMGASADTNVEAGPATGAVRDINDLYAANLGGLVGRTVEIDDVPVLSVVGDSTFYVGSGANKVLVALSNLGESQAGANGTDGRFDINTGDRVNVRGTVTRFDGANSAFRALSASDRDMQTTRGGFVNVTSAAGITKR